MWICYDTNIFVTNIFNIPPTERNLCGSMFLSSAGDITPHQNCWPSNFSQYHSWDKLRVLFREMKIFLVIPNHSNKQQVNTYIISIRHISTFIYVTVLYCTVLYCWICGHSIMTPAPRLRHSDQDRVSPVGGSLGDLFSTFQPTATLFFLVFDMTDIPADEKF